MSPLFKKGVRYDPLNYRPISLTSVPCKMLERLVVEHLTLYLEENDMLSADQFGFRSGRAVDDQLLRTYNSVSSWIDDGWVVDVILFDFTKAFDKVNHRLLLSKLGISGALLEWIESFLTDRSMFVRWVVIGARQNLFLAVFHKALWLPRSSS